jgi:acetyltransferase-like isoleucine patch superfamily enzyme
VKLSNIEHLLKVQLWGLVEWVISPIPEGLGRRIRYSYYKRRLKFIGKKVVIDVGVRIINPKYVSIGDNTWIDNYVVILAGPPGERDGPLKRKLNHAFKYSEGEVVIGSNCHIAMFVVLQGHGGLSIGDNSGIASGSLLYSMSHHYRNTDEPNDLTVYKFSPMAPSSEQSLVVSPVVMEANTALGLNSVMLPGATIHEGSWVGTNSMVLNSIPPWSIASGAPAQIISERKK